LCLMTLQSDFNLSYRVLEVVINNVALGTGKVFVSVVELEVLDALEKVVEKSIVRRGDGVGNIVLSIDNRVLVEG
jgi:hypothetical protein